MTMLTAIILIVLFVTAVTSINWLAERVVKFEEHQAEAMKQFCADNGYRDFKEIDSGSIFHKDRLFCVSANQTETAPKEFMWDINNEGVLI